MTSEDDEEDASIGGFVRGVVKSFRTASKALPGQLPSVPKRTVAQGIDKLSAVVDMGLEVDKVAVTEDKDKQKSKHKNNISMKANSRLSGLFSQLLLALPNFLKTTALGTILFEVYDEVSTHLVVYKYREAETETETETEAEADAVAAAGEASNSSALMAGAAAGAIHGVLFHAWDAAVIKLAQTVHTSTHLKNIQGSHISSFMPPSYTPLPSLSIVNGTILSHSIAHGSLFSSYLGLKRIMWNFIDEHDRNSGSLKGIFAVAVAGGMSGMISEAFGIYTGVFEEKGVVRGLKSFSLSPKLIANRKVVVASFPGCLGFLAYEFGKDIIKDSSQ